MNINTSFPIIRTSPDDLLAELVAEKPSFPTIQTALGAIGSRFGISHSLTPRRFCAEIASKLKFNLTPLCLTADQDQLLKIKIPLLMAYALYAHQKQSTPSIKITTHKKTESTPYSTEVKIQDDISKWDLESFPVKPLVIDTAREFGGPKIIFLNKNDPRYKRSKGGINDIRLGYSPSGTPIILRKKRVNPQKTKDENSIQAFKVGKKAYENALELRSVESALPFYGVAYHKSNGREKIALTMPKASTDFFHFLRKSDPLSWDQKVAYAEEILDLLRDLHSHNQSHGDIKLANLVLWNNKLKWIDFDKSNGDPLTTFSNAPPEAALHSYIVYCTPDTEEADAIMNDMERRKAVDIFMTGVTLLDLFAQDMEIPSLIAIKNLHDEIESVAKTWNQFQTISNKDPFDDEYDDSENEECDSEDEGTSQVRWDEYVESPEWEEYSANLDIGIQEYAAQILLEKRDDPHRLWLRRIHTMLDIDPQKRSIPT